MYTEPYVIYNGFRSYGSSELWVVGAMARRNRDLTPCVCVCLSVCLSVCLCLCLYASVCVGMSVYKLHKI